MRQLRNILLILVPIMLVLILPTLLLADSPSQFDPADYEMPTFAPDAPSKVGEIPSIEDGVPYRFPLVTTPSETQEADPRAADQLAIDVWYGDSQTFSQIGSPQLWANILGTVTGLDPENPAHSLSYTINGGDEQALSIGSDEKRLYGPGDFNIELSVGNLIPQPGTNDVVIKADDGTTSITKNVTVEYVSGTDWPIPYTADWSTMGGNVQQGAQVVDGEWLIDSGALTPSSPGYDRLVTLGDYFWQDYEVKVPVTITSWNVGEWEGPPSNGGGIGLVLRWRGHYQTPDNEQPRLGWSRMGARIWYRLEPKTNPNRTESSFQMLGHGGGRIATRTDLQLQTDKTYWFKASVQSSAFAGQPATYRFKVWEDGQPEPTQWAMTAQGRSGEPPTGALLLVAHQVMAEFGNVEVTPLPEGPFTINVLPTANGQIVLDPDKSEYSYGEKVQIRAVGAPGYKLTGWTNGLSGSQNPITFDVTQNLTVGANFGEASPPPDLNITLVGNGTVARDAQPPYLYGQLVELTPNPGAGYIFAGWSGDLEGISSPASIVLDETKNITATFVPTSTSSPVSDDFNACGLNTDLWTFVNPLGDGYMLVNGTELQITVPSDVAHDIWGENNSARLMQPTQNGSFEIVTKFDSQVTQRYQTQGIVVEQDAQNYLRFDAHYDGQGVRLFIARIVNGTPTEIYKSSPQLSTPAYLRVTRIGNQWTFSYSANGTTWTAAGSAFNHTMTVSSSGVFASNQGFLQNPIPSHTAIVDYFFNTDSPIVPEDGNPLTDFTIQVDSIGEGTVTITPDQATYQCGDTVTLTASPAAGWGFSGWSGDLSGTSPQQVIVVEQDYVITANFTEGVVPGSFQAFIPMTVDVPEP